MEIKTFEAQLKADGYTEIETATLAPRPANGVHGHHFSVRALVLEGGITITRDDKPITYRPGDIYAVLEGELHFEEIGPEGLRAHVGKRY